MLHGHRLAAWTCTYIIDMFMQHGRGHVACVDMDVQDGHEHT
jgi:hypothetical protein